LQAIKIGTKYIYQAVPRVLTLWLDMGEIALHEKATGDIINTFEKVHREMVDAATSVRPLKVRFVRLV
jgi:hypothetical protein